MGRSTRTSGREPDLAVDRFAAGARSAAAWVGSVAAGFARGAFAAAVFADPAAAGFAVAVVTAFGADAFAAGLGDAFAAVDVGAVAFDVAGAARVEVFAPAGSAAVADTTPVVVRLVMLPNLPPARCAARRAAGAGATASRGTAAPRTPRR